MENKQAPLPMFAGRLCIAIANKQWTAMDLTRATGLHNNTILSYLTGKSEPKAQNIVTLCLALSVTPDFLLGFTNQLPSHKEGGEK